MESESMPQADSRVMFEQAAPTLASQQEYQQQSPHLPAPTLEQMSSVFVSNQYFPALAACSLNAALLGLQGQQWHLLLGDQARKRHR
jgi:hypothetical protein